MKKVILSLAIVVIAVVITLNVNLNSKKNNDKLSLLSLSNIEALALNENKGTTLDCWDTITNDRSISNPVLSTHKTYCGSCDAALVTSWEDESTCQTK